MSLFACKVVHNALASGKIKTGGFVLLNPTFFIPLRSLIMFCLNSKSLRLNRLTGPSLKSLIDLLKSFETLCISN